MFLKKLIQYTAVLGTALCITVFPVQTKAAQDVDSPEYTMGAGYEVAVPGYEAEWDAYLKEANRKGENIPDGFKTVSPFNGQTYTHNERFEGYKLFHGVDVSKYQTNIDWKKAHEAGVDYAIVRCAYRGKEAGTLNTDPYYKQNLENAVKNNVDVGVYIYSQAITVEEAIEEAEYVLELIKGYEVKLPIVLDYEYGGQPNPGRLYEAHLSAREQTDICLAFCKRVKEAGYTPMVYANNSMFTRGLYADELEKESVLWLAKWSNSDATNGVPSSLDYTYWQYGGDPQKAKISGINGTVDTNFLYMNVSLPVKNLRVNKQTDNSITLKWNSVKDADGYRIYKYDEAKKLFVTVTTTKKTTYTVKNLEAGTNYTFRVRPYWEIGGTTYKGGKSIDLAATTLPAQVQGARVTQRTSNSLKMEWNPVTGATSYNIFRVDPETQETIKIGTVSAEQTSYVAEDLNSATEYFFCVQASKNFEEKEYEGATSEIFANVTSPAQVQGVAYVARGTKYITIEWAKVEGATGYYVYKKNEQTGKYEIAHKIASADVCSVKDAELQTGKEYAYKVRAYGDYQGSRAYGKYSEVFKTVTKPKKISSVFVTDRTATKLQYSWDAVNGATHYAIYIYSANKDAFVKYATISAENTSYTLEKLSAIHEYCVKVRPVIVYGGKNIYGSYSSEVKTITNPAKVTGAEAKTKSSTSIEVTWKKQQDVSGYYVYRYNEKSKKYVKIATVAGADTTSYKNTGLTSATEYKYRIKAYKEYDGQTYVGNRSLKVSALTKPSKVKEVTVKRRTKNTITLTWKPVARATGYRIYKYDTSTGKYKYVTTVTEASYKATGLKSKKSYKYKVAAYVSYEDGRVIGVKSDEITAKTK